MTIIRSNSIKSVPFIIAISCALLPMAGEPARAASSGPVQDRIISNKIMRVCIWPDYYAISFRNPRNGALTGIDVELAREFGKDLKVDVQFVDTTFAKFMDDLEDDKCDVAMFGIGQTSQRAARIALTLPHLRSGIYAITTRNNPRIKTWSDLDKLGSVVAVQAGTFMEPYMQKSLKSGKMLIVSNPAAREEAVLSGRADAFMTDYPYAQRMRFQHEWARIVEPPKPVAETNYGFAVKKGDPQWLDRVNKFIKAIKDDGRLVMAATRNNLLPIVIRN